LGHLNDLLQDARDHGTFSPRLLDESLKSAVRGYWLELTTDQETLQQIRNIINQLLTMNDGPTQEAVNSAFGDAVRSSANQFGGDLRLLKIMLFNHETRQLRTGLRPTNEIIQFHRDRSYFTDQSVANFLNTLNL